jgi:hypothetical protein
LLGGREAATVAFIVEEEKCLLPAIVGLRDLNGAAETSTKCIEALRCLNRKVIDIRIQSVILQIFK